jgi:cephalosporin hydroxylase
MNDTLISTIDMGRERSRTNINFLFKEYGVPNTMIEVGCFEGVTTFWVANIGKIHNDNFKIYAIDPHTTSNNNESFDFTIIKRTFEYNLSKSPNNVIYVNKFSHEGLVDLIYQKEKAEFIFIDGDHTSAAVLEDMVLSWRLLPIGGVMLCDDSIGWKLIDKEGNSPVQLSPRMGIEMFIQAYWHKITLIHLPDSFQTAFVKILE